ncbi:MFS transporter [Adlercreutzia caecimuris]|uniref:MFS transporter n=1 Tax=Adlercreutzia caecimuris TaxID=671266 RepID=UPI00272A2404|nr:MFS transporter [Adlercreutzia caecimuris]
MHKAQLTNAQSLRGFLLATFAFLAIFASTAVPIPLYADYQATIGLTTADISNTMFTYLTGVTLTLLLAGRISDSFGRVPVTSLTIMLAIFGCILFLRAESGVDVLAARFVQGLAAGFGMSAVSSLVIDCVGERHLSWGSTVASCGAMFGIMIGSVGVGVLYGMVSDLTVVYGTMILVLAVCLFLVNFVHEPLDRTASLRATIRPRVFVPRDCRRLFAAVAVVYLSTWMVSCFFQSFASPIAYTCFGETSPLAGSVILALVMAPSVLGGPLVQRLDPRRALAAAMMISLGCTAALALAVGARAELAFMGVCAVFSVASGAALATALRMLLLEVNVLQLSAILSSVNLVAYAGSAVTGLVCGALLGATSYAAVFAVMAFVLAAACVFVFSAVRAAPARRKSKRLTLAHFHRKRGTVIPASEDASAGVSEDLPAPMLS